MAKPKLSKEQILIMMKERGLFNQIELPIKTSEPSVIEQAQSGVKKMIPSAQILNPTRYAQDTKEKEFGKGMVYGLEQGTLGGIPERISPKVKELTSKLKPTTEVGKLGENIGLGFGTMQGLPAKAAGIVGGIKELPKLAQSTGAGIAFGTLLPAEEDIDRLKNAAIAGGIALGGSLTLSGLNKVSNKLKSIKNAKKLETRLDILNSVDDDLLKLKNSEVDKYGKTIQKAIEKNPDTTMSLEDILDPLRKQNTDGLLDGNIKSVINKSPKLKYYFNNPATAQNITVKEADTILSELNNATKIGIKKGGINKYRVQGFANDIKGAILENLPDSASKLVQEAKSGYKAFIEPYNKVYKASQGEGFIHKVQKMDFNPRVEQAMIQILSPETYAKINDYHKALKFITSSKEFAKGLMYLLGWGGVSSYGGVKIAESMGLAK